MHHKLFQQNRINKWYQLLPKAAKLLRQNISSAVDQFDDSFTQDSEEWQMLCMMSKMQRRLVKHKCEEFHEKRILSDEDAFSATIKNNLLNLSAPDPQVIPMMTHGATKKRKLISCSWFSSFGNAKVNALLSHVACFKPADSVLYTSNTTSTR